ncbi:MAG: methionyl-tRNA formyltransferase [Candidatus Kerfeldbacteria bacterium]|nr:methionyl-tRNA formyltransferase [Candidatus Kerfeldbacteria bacterium]
MIEKTRVIFFGTSAFAVPVLEALSAVADIRLVITRPDAPAGRGKNLQSSPIRARAESLNLNVLTPGPVNNSDFYKVIDNAQPEAAVLAAYGKILPLELLRIPAKGFLNVHPSLLPRHRGPSPISGAILAGDAQTGVTLILLDQEMDHGPVIAQRSITIEPHEHHPSLEQRLAMLAAEMLQSSLLPFLEGRITPQTQNHDQATFTKLLKRQDGLIDWSQEAATIAKQIRAYDPWPGTATQFHNQPLKILDGRAVDGQASEPAGTVINHLGQPAFVCGRGLLTHIMVQPANGKPMTAADFANGQRDFIGHRLG